MKATLDAPGTLRADVNPDVVMMLCTAGHVDHGKTALVQLLTGCMTDRLKEEQERGLTIELGFAPCWLGGNLCVGIVDVPGHERFVRNMVAGVSGIDFTILVIAADDGVMPQTIEHLEIMRLLGVRRGLVALTKSDLVDAARLEARTAEIRAFLSDGFLAGAPICPVSSVTGAGYDAFYRTLVAEIRAIDARRRAGLFRMPIERVFNRQGFGVVLSGIPVAGSVAVGEEVELLPGGRRGRIRKIERFGRPADGGACGQCLAINLPAFGKEPPVRGHILAAPGLPAPARQLHLRLETIARLERPLANAEAVRVHAGTADPTGKLYLLEGGPLAGGASALATVVLDEPCAVFPGDRVIVRRASPAETVAGGEVLENDAAPRRAPRRVTLDTLRNLTEDLGGAAPGDDAWPRRRIAHLLKRRHPAGAALATLAAGALVAPAVAAGLLAELARGGSVIALSDQYFIDGGAYAACLATLRARLDEAASAGALSLTPSQLREGLDWPAPLWARLDSDLTAAREIRAQGARVVLESAASRFTPAERATLERIEALYREAAFQTPRPDELPALLGVPAPVAARLMEHLVNEGRLIALAPHVVLTRERIIDAQARVIRILSAGETLDSAFFKLEIGSSRKYALAILDWLDARRVTVRVGNLRRLTGDYQQRLLT